jgi:hypothetical protein
MTEIEVEVAVREIINGFDGVITNPQALIGRTIGEFNKKHTGLTDIEVVKTVVNKLVNP